LFQNLLIANRGEIACRIARTARRLGLVSIAVYSEADRNARHVREADEAVLIGPAPPRESYLRSDRIVEAAKASGAEAIHPGYGFLSENAAFAEAVEAAGLVFVGPPPAAIRAMGSKSEAKALMAKAGVPLVPGYHGANQDPGFLAREAERIGYPVLIKASAGGGGKGMRVVEKAQDFADQLAGAKREASGAFGDDRVLLERYLTKPRHIEVQVFADSHGNAIYLFERDCSLQRRHQKVVEEAPAPGMTAERRRAMGEAAVAAARAIGYRGAGTVEFIVEGDAFYFMEMNTRLQVEHPVTEMITGLDLVEWQLRVAAGEPLPLTQDELAIDGHAFEARIYAEDPARDFLPATGRIVHMSLPVESEAVRIDSGVAEGDEISIHYDPMIAKLIVHGHDREGARLRLLRALEAMTIVGPANNVAFLRAVAAHPAFAAAEVDTGFIARHRAELVPDEAPADANTLALAALAVLADRQAEAAAAARRSGDPYSPWNRTDGWRLNLPTRVVMQFTQGHGEGELTHEVRIFFVPGGYRLAIGERRILASIEALSGVALTAVLDGWRLTARVVRQGLLLVVDGPQGLVPLILVDPHGGAAPDVAVSGRILAPMPGKVVAVLTREGARVERGQPLLILEAMKMEHSILAPVDGTVTALRYAAGELVSEGAELLLLEAEGEAT
jgi:3-methylcrotonyl-CoA carboxylase alpha subunit